ncbi:hypothetical protein ATN91_04060 [Companilactobacillus kimchii]|uniref:Histidine kinase n=2 Tax=Companilactobacillus kimchii TaxID=2801452 RepID=A0ABR5NUH9_9LACO|nr:hypothetical protein ATN91_04060 [Companilactobacillus kimchii]KRK52432.1 histidine kinase [Companilactobacillus kimchii DSM 13961 = JCM 10707]
MIHVFIGLEFVSNSMVIFFTLLIYCEFIKRNKKSLITKIIITSLAWGYIGMIFDDFSYVLFVIFFIFHHWYKEKSLKLAELVLNPLLFSLLSEMIMFILSGLIGKFVGIIVPNYINGIDYNNLILFFELLINFILMLILIVLIRKNLVWLNDLQFKIKKLKLESQLFWMIFSLFASFELILFVGDYEEVTAFIRGTILVAFISFFSFMLWQMMNLIRIFSEREKMLNESEQNKQLGEYLKSIQEQYDDLRKFKHDFKNIILSMSMNSKEKTEKNYEKLYKELSNQKELDSELGGKIISEYKLIKNGPLRGLIVQKFLSAKARGIKLNVEIMEDINVDEDILGIIRILGILVDNAIEETVKCSTNTVNMAFIKNEDSLEISIENPTSDPIDLVNIFKLGYSTKGMNRGTGLYNVKKLVNSNSKLYLDSEIINKKLRMTLIVLEGRV